MSLIAELVNQTVDNIYSIAKDRYGDSTETSIYLDIPCRYVKSVKKVVDERGEEVISSAQIWLLPSYTDINSKCHVKVEGRTYRVITIDYEYDLDGILDHMKVYLT